MRSSRNTSFPQYLPRKTTKTTNVSQGSQFCDLDSKSKRVRMVIDGLTWGSTLGVPFLLSVPGSDWCSVSIRGRSWYCDQYYRLNLRKIYGPVKENELWRIRRNDELEAIIKGENIVRLIKCQRIRWLGHKERMQDTAIPKKMLYGKLYATRRRGRPKMRWLDDVSTDLRKM